MSTPHRRTQHHLAVASRLDVRQIRADIKRVEGFNAKLAVLITGGVGTMACAYLFALLALISLPDVISSGSVQAIVAWIAQTFLQLVLLAVIMVGQRVQAASSDARAAKQFRDTEEILDALNTKTEGGLTEVLTAIKQLERAP